MKRTTKRIGALGTATLAVMGTGIAFATWSADGSGSGAAGTLTAQSIKVVADSVSTADLYPGLTTGKLWVTLENDNPYVVTVNSMAQDTSAGKVVTLSTATASTPHGASDGTCAATMYSFANASTTLGIDVPADGLPHSFQVSGVTLDGTAPNNCQGRTATIPVTVTGTQK